MIFEFSYTTKKMEKLWVEMLKAGVCGEMQLLCGEKDIHNHCGFIYKSVCVKFFLRIFCFLL